MPGPSGPARSKAQAPPARSPATPARPPYLHRLPVRETPEKKAGAASPPPPGRGSLQAYRQQRERHPLPAETPWPGVAHRRPAPEAAKGTQRAAAEGRRAARVVRRTERLLQRQYALLNDMSKARVDQKAEEDYDQKALEYETGMAPEIMGNDAVETGVDRLLGKVQRIVRAWAIHTGQALQATLQATFEREFAWSQGDEYYGAFEMTAQNIINVLGGGGPVRSKLKLVYNAVRNNNLTKWLKVAALELERGAKAFDRRIRSQYEEVRYTPAGALNAQTRTRDDVVTKGFAADAGLGHLGKAEKDIAVEERETEDTGWFDWSQRDVFTQNKFGKMLEWSKETAQANKERRYVGDRGLPQADRRTLQVKDVQGGLSNAEVDLILKRQGNAAPDKKARNAFRANPNAQVPWSQGGAQFEIELGSASAREAAKIKARMEAGISGSTDLMMHASKTLGLTPGNELDTVRLALAGWMMANRDHSFYEVFKAAEQYGTNFNVDPANPGLEYEDAGNLNPMQKTDFQDVLPVEAALKNPKTFPRDYLSVGWKDKLAKNLPDAARDQAYYRGTLKGQGVSSITQSLMTERDTAALNRLSEEVAAAGIKLADPMPLRKNAVWEIQHHPSYIYLGNKFGERTAKRLLNSLLKTHHGGKGVDIDNHKIRLARAGIPGVILDFASAAEIAALEAVRAAVEAQAVNALTQKLADMTPINTALANAALNGLAAERPKIKAALIRNYHGDTKDLQVADKTAADVLNRTTQFEEVARMERTTGTWYSWGNRPWLAGVAGSKLRHVDTGSIQGPGLYVADGITESALYGNHPGQRALVVKMESVPTIDRGNETQMEMLRKIAGVVKKKDDDPLDESGLYGYKKVMGVNVATYPTEFLMRHYTAVKWGRLTTNQGVRMSLDLRYAPRDHLKTHYEHKWFGSDQAWKNFKAQLAESNIDTTGWTNPYP